MSMKMQASSAFYSSFFELALFGGKYQLKKSQVALIQGKA
jgi:hypothetical protein